MSSPLPIVWRETADSQTYETARIARIFNHRRPDRYPLAVVEAEHEDHVVDAIKLALQRKCRVSVRSGGHSWAAWSVRDNAILIDLGKFHHIALDERAGIVSISPSTTGKQLTEFLSRWGFMFAGGHCPDVGLGGFLLQGGMGRNCRNWGWACEQLQAVEVVTATGEHIRCDTTENSDLLWAAKGAGPGFPAVVVRFHLRIRKVCSTMLASRFIYPKERYTEVINWVTQIAVDYDQDTEIVAVGLTPQGMNKVCIMPLFVTFKNSVDEAESALEHANRTKPEGALLQITNQETSLASEYRDQATANPIGHRYMAENGYIKNDANVAKVLEEAFTTLPHPKAFSLWYAMAPCSRRSLPDMALSMQSDHYFALYTVWENEDDDPRCQKWVRDVMTGVQPHTEGAYLGDSDFQVRKAKFWTDDKAKRLMEVRRKWDPCGVICGYLDAGDKSGVDGLTNEEEWVREYA